METSIGIKFYLFIQLTVMSFRNYGFAQPQNIKIEEDNPSQLFLSSKFPPNKQNNQPNQQVISKIAEIVVNMHQNCLVKCQNLEIYRDLNSQEQELLVKADKNTVLHTALAGILAVDSCLKALEKEEKFVIGNILRANSALIATYKQLEKQAQESPAFQNSLQKTNDAIKYLTQQIQTIPSCKGRESQIQKQLTFLDSSNLEGQEWLENEQNMLLSEIQKENQMLKLAIREKDGHIKTLEGMVDRNSKIQKKQHKNTHNNRRKAESINQFQTESHSSKQHLYDQLSRLKQELQQKNTIVLKMNDQFASEMEKYNSVFKRLEDQNRRLKKYNDVDTIYLLEELQIQVEGLREQRQKDQMIISDIQRKFQGFSFNKLGRGLQHTKSHQYLGMERPQDNYHHPYPQRHHYYQERREERRERIPSKYYSPNYSSRLSPYDRAPSYRDSTEGMYPPQTSRSRLSKRQEIRNKSRIRLNNMHSSRQRQPMEPKSTPTINLLERVLSKNR